MILPRRRFLGSSFLLSGALLDVLDHPDLEVGGPERCSGLK